MRLRRLCLEIFALRRFFKEPIAGVSVCRASEAQPKHRLSRIANAFAAKSRVFGYSVALPPVEGERVRSPQRIICGGRHVRQSDGLVPRRVGSKLVVPCPNGRRIRSEDTPLYGGCSCRLPTRERFRSPQRQNQN